jgi:hypothetical protein
MSDTEPVKLDGYLLNAQPDIPDIRDWPYEPALIQLRSSIDPPSGPIVLDQKSEGACTGFGLAAVINYLNQRRNNAVRVSPRMLYEMARRYDEWEGENYSGSSCRGAVKGWHNMGVCDDKLWPYRVNRPSNLSLERAKDARKNTVGAYYRVSHRISDFHAALNEVNAIYVSADVHEGWQTSAVENGVIPFKKKPSGGHAFALVGYNGKGFWVQNSWGASWGKGGLALWTYEDWLQNMRDAWVLRLALPTPQVFHLPATPSSGSERLAEAKRAPNRAEIAGHFVHIDDGSFDERGKYWSSADDTEETANLIGESDKYDHLLFYAHGGLNSTKASARRILAMKEVFKANRIYPYHFMYDTGIMEELKDVVLRKEDETVARVGAPSDASDWLIEKVSRIPGRALWREMKSGARSPFHSRSAGTEVLELFLDALSSRPRGEPLKLHGVGHSTGGILLAHLLGRLAKMDGVPRIDTVTLMAPAANEVLFEKEYQPLLKAKRSEFGIDAMQILNLNERLEQDDTVGKLYRKSLLYLVSRAFEESPPMPLIGMERFNADLPPNRRLTFIYSDGPGGREKRTTSETHGGFDNDVASMNHVLRTVLGKKPKTPFTVENLRY